MRRYLLLVLSLFHIVLIAQNNCQFDADGNCIGKGKLKTITHKTSYGGKFTTSVRSGYWVLLNTDGIKKTEGSYKIKGEYANKEGEWKFYSDESVMLFKRWYKNGMVEKTQFIESGEYMHAGDTLIIISDSLDNFKIEERKGEIKYYYTATNLKIMKGDPSVFAVMEKKKALKEIIHATDDETSRRYPILQATQNIRLWAVNSPHNLIQNPDFEAMHDKMYSGQSEQIKTGGEELAKFWSSANETPDIFMQDYNCFAGYRVFGVNYEVLRNELKEPLKAGNSYCMQFKIRLKYENTHALNGVSVTISKNMMGINHPTVAIKNGVVLQTHQDLPLAFKEKWMSISGSFTATGGEKYLYIGNFTSDSELKLFDIDNTNNKDVQEIYYYIDDVVLIEQNEGMNCPCNVNGCALNNDTLKKTVTTNILKDDIYNKPKVGQTLVLRNIRFETAKWELLEGSSVTLDSLVELMQKFPSMKVEITGHTDNKGKAEDNIMLSANRANTVAVYLMDYGIDESRIAIKGLGQKQPIDSNATESGRFNNRRVEFKILEL